MSRYSVVALARGFLGGLYTFPSYAEHGRAFSSLTGKADGFNFAQQNYSTTVMKTLYLNPFSGIAGDMLVAALLDLGIDADCFREELLSLPLLAADWDVAIDSVMRHGIGARRFTVSCAGAQITAENDKHTVSNADADATDAPGGDADHGRTPAEILDILNRTEMAASARQRAIRTFQCLAEAEAKVHRKSPETIHFHEVGAVDSIADIAGACIAMDILEVDRIVCGPVAVGSGTVKCAHGTMPVPVPAVAELLRGVPTTIGSAPGELTTPTGAALICALADSYGEPLDGRLLATGYGAGHRDLPGQANVLQVMLLETSADQWTNDEARGGTPTDVVMIECNIDDMPGDRLTHLLPMLLAAGAVDVSVFPCLMKKGRQGMMLQAMAAECNRERLVEMILRETTTFGVRWHTARRRVLDRRFIDIDSPYGKIRVKLGFLPGHDEPLRIAPEFDSCRAAAEAHGTSFARVFDAALAVAREKVTSGMKETSS